jgi:cbb3-type cytochrome oxidase maturation protein
MQSKPIGGFFSRIDLHQHGVRCRGGDSRTAQWPTGVSQKVDGGGLFQSGVFQSGDYPMDILFLLIPLSVGLGLLILGALGWAVWRGQFDSIEAEGERILRSD